jgi:hypothetical protein
LVPQVVEVPQVHKVLKVVKDLQVIRVMLDLRVVQVQQVLKEVLDRQEDKVLKVGPELVLVLKELKEDKVHQVLMDYRHKVLKVRRVLVPWEIPVLKGLKVVLVFQVLKELKEPKDRQGVKVFKVPKEVKAYKVPKVLKVLQVIWDQHQDQVVNWLTRLQSFTITVFLMRLWVNLQFIHRH